MEDVVRAIIAVLLTAACIVPAKNVVCAGGPITFSQTYRSGGFKAPMPLRNGSLLAARTSGTAVKCYLSADVGRSWREYSTIVSAQAPGCDIGDGHLMTLENGDILYSYRFNIHRNKQTSEKSFSIRVAVSGDDGLTWKHHSTVAATKGADFGYWSSFLMERPDGTLQCYYDDERSPSLSGLMGHQWITMKTCDRDTGRWSAPVTVSRAAGSLLSRDGMCSVVEISADHLLCVSEGVQEYAPRRGCLWITESRDGGKSWAMPHRKLWEPKNTDFNALAPWAVRLNDGRLIVVFTTDEDRDKPTEASTGVLFQDLKYLVGDKDGASWAGPWTIDNNYPIYFPGACVVKDKSEAEEIIVQYFTKAGFMCAIGRAANE